MNLRQLQNFYYILKQSRIVKSKTDLAKVLDYSRQHTTQILNGQIDITQDFEDRLFARFGNLYEHVLNLGELDKEPEERPSLGQLEKIYKDLQAESKKLEPLEAENQIKVLKNAIQKARVSMTYKDKNEEILASESSIKSPSELESIRAEMKEFKKEVVFSLDSAAQEIGIVSLQNKILLQLLQEVAAATSSRTLAQWAQTTSKIKADVMASIKSKGRRLPGS